MISVLGDSGIFFFGIHAYGQAKIRDNPEFLLQNPVIQADKSFVRTTSQTSEFSRVNQGKIYTHENIRIPVEITLNLY